MSLIILIIVESDMVRHNPFKNHGALFPAVSFRVLLINEAARLTRSGAVFADVGEELGIDLYIAASQPEIFSPRDAKGMTLIRKWESSISGQ